MVDLNRRGFLGNLLFSGLGLYTGVEASQFQEESFPTAISNPTFSSPLNIDDIYKDLQFKIVNEGKDRYELENKNVKISFDGKDRKFRLKVPMNMQMLYSATKELWMQNLFIQKYSYPFMAITPEMFEVQNNWDINIEKIRCAGLKVNKTTRPYSTEDEYCAINVLTQEGMVYDSNHIEIPNSGLLTIIDGKVSGYYRKNEGEKLLDLQAHLEKTIGIEKIHPIQYRIP